MADAPEKASRSVMTDQIRMVRRKRGLTLERLSEATGLDKGYLSRIERGRVPSIGALLKIADALGVPIGQLFGEQVDPSTISVVRREDRKSVPAAFGGCGHHYEPLILGDAAGGLEAFIIYPSKERGESATHNGHEFVFVLHGAAEIDFADRSVQLRDGDCIHFPGTLRHRICGDEGSAVLVMIAREPG